MRRELVHFSDPILRTPTWHVTGEDIKDLVEDMRGRVDVRRCVGIAANQLGSNLRVCVVALSSGIEVMVNPAIVSASEETEPADEGCLSFDKVQVTVYRPVSVTVRWEDEKQEAMHEQTFTGFDARVVQHEIDHLDGVVMTDRVSRSVRRRLQAQGKA